MTTEDEHNTGVHYEEHDEHMEPEVERGLSIVAASPAKNLAVMILVGIIIVVAVYYSFFKDDKPPVKVPTAVPVTGPITPVNPPEIAPQQAISPPLPQPPELVPPTPPTPPPAPVIATPSAPPIPAPSMAPPQVQAPVQVQTQASPPAPMLVKSEDEKKLSDEEAENRKAARLARIKAPMTAGGGSGGGASGESGSGGGSGGSGGGSLLGSLLKGKSSSSKGSDRKSDGGDDFDIAGTAASQVKVTTLGNPSYTVAQGKLIDAILETAINTDLPGVLRAIVSRDIYAEAGQTILIPRGSRLVGAYVSDVKRGQKRVQIAWSRLIRPDGIDIQIESPATDPLGRAGLTGQIDNKYTELFSSAILLTTITTGFAIVADKASNSQPTTTSTTTGSGGSTTSTTGTAASSAISGGVSNIGSIASNVAQDFLDMNPTITVEQGTKIIVFVNKDLVFPSSLLTPTKSDNE